MPRHEPAAPRLAAAHHASDHDRESSFQDLAAEQLRRAPWLVLSAIAHAVLLFLLYVLLPQQTLQREELAYFVQPEAAQPVAQPPKPPEPEPRHELERRDDPQLVDEDFLDEPNEVVDAVTAEVPTTTPSAFEFAGTNAAVGIGGNAGGPPGGGRTGGRRRAGRPTPPAVQRGLLWLERHQDEDGKWDCDGFMKHDLQGVACDGPGNAVHDVGVTGLALLAFLGEGNTLRGGPHQQVVRDAVRWLREQQGENGLYGTASSNDFVYDHAIAAYAMCEAFGLSSYVSLRDTAQRGLDYLAMHRNPYGAWRYQPRDGDSDTSVTGWCVQALESGRSFGLVVDAAALRTALQFLESVTDTQGRAGYTHAGEPSSRHPGAHATRFPPEKGEALTAVALFSRFFLGQQPKETPAMRLGADLLLQKPPVWDAAAGTIDHYYWYYATYALYQAGGRHWAEWQKKVDTAVVRHQRGDDNFAGSWDPDGVWGEDGGRVYATAILTLTLQAHYRYAPFVR